MGPMGNKRQKNEIVIVLAMHGIPPKDFPKKEWKELFGLRAALKHNEKPDKATLDRHAILDQMMREWPRTEKNDSFYAGSVALGLDLSEKTGMSVIVGYNEFCAPDLDKAIAQAVHLSTLKVIVTTPMMTRGGGHSKTDIPEAIARVRKRHPKAEIVYAWPFPLSDIAGFLAGQIQTYTQ